MASTNTNMALAGHAAPDCLPAQAAMASANTINALAGHAAIDCLLAQVQGPRARHTRLAAYDSEQTVDVEAIVKDLQTKVLPAACSSARLCGAAS